MFRSHRIAVVVPAYNEAEKIARTLRSIPGFVDHVLVIDDASWDGTARRASRTQRRGLEVIRHAENRGVGAAIATGYARAYALNADVTAVMAGDSQMDPADLVTLIGEVVEGRADYVKGNRFRWPRGWRMMPLSRLCGNLALSYLTRVASGYGRVFDSQCGYTAANRRALATIRAGEVFPRYGYPNDLLIRLGRAEVRVADVPVRPVYGDDWRSGIRIHKVVGPLLRLLLRATAERVMRAGWRKVGGTMGAKFGRPVAPPLSPP